jgi:hypothetical protein
LDFGQKYTLPNRSGFNVENKSAMLIKLFFQNINKIDESLAICYICRFCTGRNAEDFRPADESGVRE